MNIEEQIRRYIYKKVDKLRKEGDWVQLYCVYPDVVNYVLGYDKDQYSLNLEDSYEFNGNNCNYRMTMGKYNINGSMRFGTATVTLREDK